jgi:hypothetical protein
MKELSKSLEEDVRSISCEILGRIARVDGNPLFVNPLFDILVDQVVNNREPEARAGACFAQGSIYNFVGGMAVGSHLKTSIGILHSLASDLHPLVHTWALHSLWLTIQSAGLMYGPFVNSTLSLITKLYMSESHELVALAANTNDDNNGPVFPALGRILHALVGVIGPELESSPKLRDMCFNLFDQLKNDLDPFVVVEAIKCIQNFIMFAPKYVDIPTIIPFLQKHLQDTKSQTVIRTAAITCLYQLTQKDPGLVLDSALDKSLEEQLFTLFDLELDPAIRSELQDILHSLLSHVSTKNPSRWIDLCKNILFKSAGMNEKNAQEIVEDSDEHEQKPEKQVAVTLLPRWRTQVFSLDCIELVISKVLKKNNPADFNLLLAMKSKEDFLVFRLSDLIRLSFNSSTASVSFLKLSGLKLLKKILDNFANQKDPDFPEHSLLQQYEAQIISAMAPGFEQGASPVITTAACQICSEFLSSGILEDMSLGSRPIRLLFMLLSQFTGDVKLNGRTPTSNVVVKLGVTSALAKLYTLKKTENLQKILFADVLADLYPLWVESLVDYAKLKCNIASSKNSGSNPLYDLAARGITLPVLFSLFSTMNKRGLILYMPCVPL